MRRNKTGSVVKLMTVVYLIALVVGADAIKGCKTRKCNDRTQAQPQEAPAPATTSNAKGVQYKTLSSLLTVADIRMVNGGVTEVIFNENTGYFTVGDAAVIAKLKSAFSTNTPLQVTFDPWQGAVVSADDPTTAQLAEYASREVISSAGTERKIDLSTTLPDVIDQPSPEFGVINKTEAGLVNVIPDFATAQLMFDYISKQCCAIGGPYAIDYCISFQYCQDGCYARAHKMCYIINKKYNYGTQKIFSFALTSTSDKLCVQGQKWGGCCINWWYHVAPLVTIQTPTGPKAYVFDPAMFNQPVLLSTWLHAQENPSCVPSGKTPHVTKINIQPTSAYTPANSAGTMFNTDPSYSATNTTLWNYRNLKTCP
jgi:hypothetical protein